MERKYQIETSCSRRENDMNKYSRLFLAGAAALVWTAIAGSSAALADSPTQKVRSKQVAANMSDKLRTAQVASPASCQIITCPRYRLVGIAY